MTQDSMGFMRRKRLAEQQGESNTSAFHAGNLYEDFGAVALTLIKLRCKQAEAGISKLLPPNE